jgi:hypothetical protein
MEMEAGGDGGSGVEAPPDANAAADTGVEEPAAGGKRSLPPLPGIGRARGVVSLKGKQQRRRRRGAYAALAESSRGSGTMVQDKAGSSSGRASEKDAVDIASDGGDGSGMGEDRHGIKRCVADSNAGGVDTDGEARGEMEKDQGSGKKRARRNAPKRQTAAQVTRVACGVT